jgi:DNA-binding LacI/PurR family transcriptional regulator
VVTIADVARQAEVSSSTVSYALSGKRAISARTRQRVLAAAEQLRYRPNASAQALASRRTNVLALVAPFRPDNNVSVLLEFVAAIAVGARESGRDILLMTQEEGVAGVARVRDSAMVDAAIVMDIDMADSRLPVFRSGDLPCVLIGYPERPGSLSCVDLDMQRAGDEAVRALTELGHRSVIMLGSPPAVYERASTYAVRFASGFQAAVAATGIDATLSAVDHTYGPAAAKIEELLDAHPEATGIVVHNEAILSLLLSVLERRGRRVPADLSIVAVCPSDMAEAQRVPLTNIAIPAAEIGRLAVEMVLKQLDFPGSSAELRLLAPTLVVRSSTAPPRDG